MNLVEKELKKFTCVVQNHIFDLQNFEKKLDVDDSSAWEFNKSIVSIKLSSVEQIEEADLINTDNKILDRTIKILYTLCKEASNLMNDVNKIFYFPILLYGKQSSEKEQELSPHENLSQFLPVLEKLTNHVDQVEEISLNFLLQMNALYPHEKKSSVTHAGEAHFQVVFEHLSRVLGSLLILDEVIMKNPKLVSDLQSYHSFIKGIKGDSSVHFDPQDILNLECIIKEILDKISSSIFKSTLIKLFKRCGATLENNKKLQDEMQAVFMGWSSKIDGPSSESYSDNIEEQVVSLTVLVLLCHTIFTGMGSKVAKELLVLYKKVPCCMSEVGHTFIGEKFIKTHFRDFYSLFDRKELESLNNFRNNYLANKTQSLSNEVHLYSIKVVEWSIRMELASQFPINLLTTKELSQKASFVFQGLFIASYLKYMADSIVGLHSSIGSPIGKTSVTSICNLLELLQAIQNIYLNHAAMFVEVLPHLRQHFGFQILNFLKKFKKEASSAEKINPHQLDLLAAISVAEQSLYSNATKTRRLLARISLSLVAQHSVISPQDFSTLSLLLKRLELIDELQLKVKKVTEVKFLFQHHILIHSYLQECYRSIPHQSHRMQFMMSAIDNNENLQLGKSFWPDEALEIFQKEFVDKLCKTFEKELRLSTHKHLELDGRNPYEASIVALKPSLSIPRLKVSGRNFNIKRFVEQYLDRTFYSLTVLAPHNCCVYRRMRDFASSNYEIVTTKSSLPAQDLEQGVDVLEIMRNMESFVERYQYNLHQQFFIENVQMVHEDKKYLNIVSLKHIANSIRTHGTGIINTTVNFTYQYLRKKFHVLSQFLFDEHIKSRLLRDLQYWKEIKSSSESFPFERAEKFNRGIRKLGFSSKGLTYLDQFRKLITQMGNTIGFVRLVRSGGVHVVSSVSQFIPSLESVPMFQDLCSNQGSSTYEASLLLDEVTNNLNTFFNLETDYLKILVEAFGSLRDPKNAHLWNFFLIVPPLTINFIEHFITIQGNSKSKSEPSSFTDDGFIIGLSYILKVLDQESSFNSLHWTIGVRRKFALDKKKVKEAMAKGGDEKLQQTLALSLTKIEQQLTEFDLLFWGLNSARVFFSD